MPGKKKQRSLKSQDFLNRLIHGKDKKSSANRFYDIVDTDIYGKEVHLSEYEGNVILVINVASKCGLAKKHYADLPKLADEYGHRGFQILAFPCNQFLSQDPGKGKKNLEIIDCKKCIKWFEQGNVNGPKTRDVYGYLKRELRHCDNSGTVRWNFEKFLIDYEGKPFRRYDKNVSLEDMREDIEYLLDLRGPSKHEIKMAEREEKLAQRTYDIYMG